MIEQSYILSPKNIDIISTLIDKYMQQSQIPHKVIIRVRLATETILLSWLEKAPQETKIWLKIGKNYLRPYVSLQFTGEKQSPQDITNNDSLTYYDQIIDNINLSINYQYDKGNNIVKINLPMITLGNSWKVFVAISFAVISSYGLRYFCDNSMILFIRNLIEPIFTSLISFLSAIAAFMIFFNILCSVITMSNVGHFNKIGLRATRFIVGHNLFAVFMTMVFCFFYFNIIDLQTNLDINSVESLLKLLFNIIPKNLIDPFIQGDTVKIMFLAISSGIILSVLDQQTKGIISIVKECNAFFSTAINYFCTISPIIVYLTLTDILLQGNWQHMLTVGKILFATTIVGTIYLLQDTLLGAIHSRMGIKNYFLNLLPIFKTALCTGNAAACGELFDDTCKKINFDKSFYEYGSLASPVFTSTGTIIVLMCTIMGFKEYCGQTISLSEFIIRGVIYLLIAPSAFAVPGGSISVVALLMSQNFLPEYCISIYIAANLLFDILITAINAISSVNNLVGAAWLVDMLHYKNK